MHRHILLQKGSGPTSSYYRLSLGHFEELVSLYLTLIVMYLVFYSWLYFFVDYRGPCNCRYVLSCPLSSALLIAELETWKLSCLYNMLMSFLSWLLFVDHLTMYVWHYTFTSKSGVFPILHPYYNQGKSEIEKTLLPLYLNWEHLVSCNSNWKYNENIPCSYTLLLLIWKLTPS